MFRFGVVCTVLAAALASPLLFVESESARTAWGVIAVSVFSAGLFAFTLVLLQKIAPADPANAPSQFRPTRTVNSAGGRVEGLPKRRTQRKRKAA